MERNSLPIENSIMYSLDWIKDFTNSKRDLFYFNIVTLNSPVKNLAARYEYVNIKHRKDSGYVKMETYLGIELLWEAICVRLKQTWYLLLPDISYGT